MDPDDSGIPQAIRSKFRAGCDYSVRVSSFRLGFVTNWTLQFDTCDDFAFGGVPSKGRGYFGYPGLERGPLYLSGEW